MSKEKKRQTKKTKCKIIEVFKLKKNHDFLRWKYILENQWRLDTVQASILDEPDQLKERTTIIVTS